MTGTFLPHDMPDGTPLKRKRGRPKGSMGSAKQALVPPSPASPVVIGAAPTNRGRPRKSMTPSKMTVVRELGGSGPSSSAFPAPPPVPQRLASPTRQVVSPAGRIPDTTTAPSPVPITPAVPRGRGRPRKHPVGVTVPRAPPAVKSTAAQTPPMQMPPMQMPPMASTVLPGGAAAAVPRGRGRPRKHPQTETDVRSKQPKQPMPAAGAPKRPVGRPRKVPEITTSPGLRNGSPGRVPVAATAPTTATAAAVPRHDPPGPSMPLEKNTAGPSATPRRAKLPKLPKIPKIRVVQLVPESVKRQRKNHGSLIQALTASDSDDSRDTESESDSEDARRNGVQRTEQTSPSRERVRTSPARRIVSSDLNNPSNARPAPSGGGGMPPGAFPLPQSLLQHHLDYGVDDYMGADAVRDEPQMDAVVKVFCSHTEPNFSLPWQRKRQSSSTSSGFIIGGNRVLTNAHSVEHHTQVKLKKRGEEKKYVARVLAVGTECDLALLSVDDVSFFQNVTPVRFGHLPSLQDSVTVVGYPIGGVAISVTQGVVSRIEVTAYSHGSSELLGLQIDAAINSGNSGGPAFNKDGECVGVAFQSLKHEDAENIGYVIPSPVIVHFLQDYARNGKYTGFPTLGVEWQKLENPDMRKFLKMRSLNERTEHGVYVRRVSPTSPAGALIQTTDVLLSFDGVPIANDGTVPFRTGERISFHYLVSEKYVGERAEVRFLRQGKVRTASLTLSTTPRLVPVHIPTETPTYFIVAGLVFTNVCVPYLKSEYGKDYDYDAPVRLLDTMMHDHVRFPGQNVVVLAQVLASDVTIGYEDIVNSVVKGFNGVAVNDLKQLAWMVDSCGEEFLRFQLEHEQLVVLKRTVAVKETKEILKTHGIPDAKSADLR